MLCHPLRGILLSHRLDGAEEHCLLHDSTFYRRTPSPDERPSHGPARAQPENSHRFRTRPADTCCAGTSRLHKGRRPQGPPLKNHGKHTVMLSGPAPPVEVLCFLLATNSSIPATPTAISPTINAESTGCTPRWARSRFDRANAARCCTYRPVSRPHPGAPINVHCAT